MAGQPVHPNGKFHQVDFERNRCHWRVVVARQCIWIVPLHFPRASRIANAAEQAVMEKSGSRIQESPVQSQFGVRRKEDRTEELRRMRSGASVERYCKGDIMLKSVRIVGVSAAFLLLGWTVPAGAWQEKQEEKTAPARQEQQAKPEGQQQTRAPQQQQQAKPQHQQQAQAPQRQQQAKPEKQQQANGQQDQQHQQHQLNSAKQQPQQAKGRHQTQHQQAVSSQRPERTQQAMAAQRAQPALRLSARGSGRIPDDRFRSNFGREHEFHMGNPVFVGGYSRFQYGGYWFGFVEPWPVGWYYTDDVYIDYVDGGYYMFDPYYPGARFAISVVL
jgi:hypothetical protein